MTASAIISYEFANALHTRVFSREFFFYSPMFYFTKIQFLVATKNGLTDMDSLWRQKGKTNARKIEAGALLKRN